MLVDGISSTTSLRAYWKPTLFDEGLVENGAEGRVQLLLHVLQQHRRAKLHRVFQGAQEVWLLQVYDLQILWEGEARG